MANGFRGNASHRYLSTISTAMTSAHAVHNRNPFAGMSAGTVAPPALPATNNRDAPHSPDISRAGGGHMTGVGNQTNIVVRPGDYNETLQKIQMVDTKIAEEIYNLAVQIEEMCDTIYIVPFMRPKYLEYISRVKSSLDEFQTLTDDARMRTHELIDEITRIDGK